LLFVDNIIWAKSVRVGLSTWTWTWTSTPATFSQPNIAGQPPPISALSPAARFIGDALGHPQALNLSGKPASIQTRLDATKVKAQGTPSRTLAILVFPLGPQCAQSLSADCPKPFKAPSGVLQIRGRSPQAVMAHRPTWAAQFLHDSCIGLQMAERQAAGHIITAKAAVRLF
jgi:hypothetical protein